ncbi:hypothetical protein LAZ67_3006007 [Cordylochernes scorpioides]|uniref:Iron-sulfur protein NUBPL n=1 Tax=Cordylochernes scorpioides TaxID=51811 RepID=A0ABY6KE98_9ARAC|nr:hypothetical protein LAZ67_3006007 [Cordylochernes scorpioides]
MSEYFCLFSILGIPQKTQERIAKGLPKKLPIAGVEHVILVSSAKGGVGKSTIAVNLATALHELKKDMRIGLLDADVFGPSIPILMNLNDQPEVNKQNLILPLSNYGIKCMSMGFLVEEQSAIVWRGLMVMSAIQKLLRQVMWGPLDVLVVDMPPGTGDTQLSICQSIPISGAILVSTPQRLAMADVRRGVKMFQTVGVPTLGLVQNMSRHTCSKCGHSSQLFGQKDVAGELGLPLLADIPLSQPLEESTDCGKPLVISQPHSDEAKEFFSLSRKVYSALKIS